MYPWNLCIIKASRFPLSTINSLRHSPYELVTSSRKTRTLYSLQPNRGGIAQGLPTRSRGGGHSDASSTHLLPDLLPHCCGNHDRNPVLQVHRRAGVGLHFQANGDRAVDALGAGFLGIGRFARPASTAAEVGGWNTHDWRNGVGHSQSYDVAGLLDSGRSWT